MPSLSIPLPHSDGDIFQFGDDFHASQIGLLPFARLYLGDLDKPAVWFLWLESGFYFAKSTFPEVRNGFLVFRERNATDWGIGGGFGVNAFVSKKAAISVALKGQYVENLNGDFFLGYPFLSLHVGVQVFVNPRRKEANK